MHNLVLKKSDIIQAFTRLGEWFTSQEEQLIQAKEMAYIKNNWFTDKNVELCFQNWHNCLNFNDISVWLQQVPERYSAPKTVGIIMAGNIPLVGLHDLLCVLAMGHRAQVKLSQNDEVLMKACIEKLKHFEPALEEQIQVVERISKPDAMIATGSNNTARYFDYYFSQIPRIVRKNRTSIAILDGDETEADLRALADDIFQYFGLGCRNVTKLLIPEDYDLKMLLDATSDYAYVIDHNKFANNYTYHKAIFLMNLTEHLDTGYLLVKEDEKLHSPLACLFYERYNNGSDLSQWVDSRKDEIQVVVSNMEGLNAIPFGSTQRTTLTDYADGVNTLDFLAGI